MKMSESSDNNKYKWTPESTTLLVSVWTDRQVQKQIEYTVKPQLIWESIAKYMRKKGYEVTARQCRSRIKQVLVCYREAKKTGTRAGVERYYESIDKVLEEKRFGKLDGDTEGEVGTENGGVDTVDSAQMNLKSPEKETKTHTNFLMRRNKFEEPPEPIIRQVDIDHAPWQYIQHQDYYGDSSESNETVLARPHRSLSPPITRESRLNAESKILRPNIGKSSRRSLTDDRYRYNTLEANRFSDIPLKNAVQNVQNQIIQENMLLRNQLSHDYMGNQMGLQPQSMDYCLNIGNIPQRNYHQENMMYQQPTRMSTNLARIQSQLQQCALTEQMDIHQPPQGQKNFLPFNSKILENNGNYKSRTSNYNPDIGPNLNEAFCQPKLPKVHNLNETYDQDTFPVNTTTITNNATFNDDTLSIEFIEDSRSPSENGLIDSKTDSPHPPPNVPMRKKKAQKLEQLMINAITSQNEVVNKILAAQDSMVSKILDRDQDRQNRLETRLDQLMNVVHATVLNKSASSSTKESELHSAPTVINSVPLCFSPPPKPGAVPPKLDLVPPKPCRVPCTSPSTNIELVNQAPVTTKPGVIRPTKPGSIWMKLGPVTASPFVQAQKEMNGLRSGVIDDWRTKSSAERRIAMSGNGIINGQTLITETERFLQSEKLMEERIQNARQIQFDELPRKIDSQPARRQLFNPSETEESKAPSAAMILTSTFLDIERKAEEKSRYIPIYDYKTKATNDELLSGQTEDFERLRSLGEALGLNTSTPAKVEAKRNREIEKIDAHEQVPKQTIQQLAQLVMQSQRWKNAAVKEIQTQIPTPPPPPVTSSLYDNYAQRQGYNKAKEWLKDRYSYGIEKRNYEPPTRIPGNYPMGFVNPKLNYHEDADIIPRNDEYERYRAIGFNTEILPTNRYPRENDFLDNGRGKCGGQRPLHKANQPGLKQRDMIDKYEHDNYSEKETKHKRNADSDAEDNDEYLDTTTTYRKTSLTSNGTSGPLKNGAACVVS